MVNKHEYLYWGERMFIVNRKIEENRIKPDASMDVMKEWTGSDIILRKEGILYCCTEIEDAQIIEESSEN